MLVAGCLVLSNCRRSTVPGAPVLEATGGDSVSFIVLGDWGKQGGQNQYGVADQMDRAARKHNCRFVVTTGDNFYYNGVRSITDPHWKSSFEDVYHHPSLQINWHPVLGNHDYGYSVPAQITYSAISGRWRMPARYYQLEQRIGEDSDALLMFTDTSPFIGAYHRGGYSDLSTQDTAAQIQWLQQSLYRSRARWKIVIGHHPLYSVGPHGHSQELIQRFGPLFRETDTDFYLSGHDHSLQEIVKSGTSTRFLVSGGGSEFTRVRPDADTRFAAARTGFLVMTLYPRHVNYYFYSKGGRVLYARQLRK